MKYSTLTAEPAHMAPMLRGVAHRSDSGMKSMPCCSTRKAGSPGDPSCESMVVATEVVLLLFKPPRRQADTQIVRAKYARNALRKVASPGRVLTLVTKLSFRAFLGSSNDAHTEGGQTGWALRNEPQRRIACTREQKVQISCSNVGHWLHPRRSTRSPLFRTQAAPPSAWVLSNNSLA